MKQLPAFLLLCSLGITTPGWSEINTRQGVSVLGEYDTNARRLAFEKEADGSTPSSVMGDGLMRTVTSLGMNGQLGRLQFNVDAALGTKMFYSLADERMTVGQVQSQMDIPLVLGFRGRVQNLIKGRGQTSLSRSYVLERTEFALMRPVWRTLVRAGVRTNGFYSVDATLFSSMGPGHFVGASLFATPKEVIDLETSVGVRSYPLLLASEDALLPRLDVPARLSLIASSQRNFFVSTGYLFTRNLSISKGESFFRHQFFGSIGYRFPADILCTIRGTFRFTQYDDGVSLGQRLFLADDDESQNTAQVYLSRPWIGGLHTEARVAWYGNEWARNGLEFSRLTTSLGLRYEAQ